MISSSSCVLRHDVTGCQKYIFLQRNTSIFTLMYVTECDEMKTLSHERSTLRHTHSFGYCPVTSAVGAITRATGGMQ